MSDRSRLPYVTATIEEVMRHCPMYYTNAAHMTLEETKLAGYTFPEGTVVFVNYGAIQRDPKHFKDPDIFR